MSRTFSEFTPDIVMKIKAEIKRLEDQAGTLRQHLQEISRRCQTYTTIDTCPTDDCAWSTEEWEEHPCHASQAQRAAWVEASGRASRVRGQPGYIEAWLESERRRGA
jgi:hypothetical protein